MASRQAIPSAKRPPAACRFIAAGCAGAALFPFLFGFFFVSFFFFFVVIPIVFVFIPLVVLFPILVVFDFFPILVFKVFVVVEFVFVVFSIIVIVELVIEAGYCGPEATSVIDLTSGTPTLVRAGRGDLAPFGLEE